MTIKKKIESLLELEFERLTIFLQFQTDFEASLKTT
jgi:hypothetical protein